MSQQQQQPAPVVHPSLAELDTPVEQTQQQQQSTAEGSDRKPEESKSPEKTETENTDEKPTVTEETTTEETTEEENDDPLLVFGEVSKLRGDGFEFKFPADVDPATPQGLHHAIQQVVDHELDLFEEAMMKGDARAYAYMLHRNNGGSDEDFFKDKTEVLPEWETLKNSVDLQQAFYKRSLIRRGNLPEHADLIIKDAIDKNKLAVLVEADYNDTKKKEEQQLQQLLKISQANQEKEERQLQKMGSTLQEIVIQNKGLNITIPDAKRGEFLQFVNSMMMYNRDTGQWFVQKEFTPENMGALIEALYYLKVGGNMDEIISRKADQKNVARLKMKMGKEKQKTATQPDPNQKLERQGVHTPVSEL